MKKITLTILFLSLSNLYSFDLEDYRTETKSGFSKKRNSSTEEIALLANDVYSNKKPWFKKGKPTHPSVSEKFTLIKTDTSIVSGFKANIYNEKNSDNLVISFAGTEPKAAGEHALWLATTKLSNLKSGYESDIIADIKLAAGDKPKQFEQASKLVKKMKNKYPNKNIVLTGHSLGGGLAVYAGQTNKVDAIAYNAPRLNNKLYSDVPYDHRMSFLPSKGPRWVNLQSSDSSKKDIDLVSGLTNVLADKNLNDLSSLKNQISKTFSVSKNDKLVVALSKIILEAKVSNKVDQLYKNLNTNFGDSVVDTIKLNTGCIDGNICHAMDNFIPSFRGAGAGGTWAYNPNLDISSKIAANQLQGNTSQIGTASIQFDNTPIQKPWVKIYKDTNGNNLPAGVQLGRNGTFEIAAFELITGDNGKHLLKNAKSFGTITIPSGTAMAVLNNADIQQGKLLIQYKVPVGVNTANIQAIANFVTNEFPEFVGSKFDDKARIQITTPGGNISQIQLFGESLNGSNFTAVNNLPSPLSSTGGATGFKTGSANNIRVAPGGKINIEISVDNVGDLALPSAIIIDKIKVK